MDFKNIFGETVFLGEGTQYVEKVEASSRRLKDFFEKAFSEFGIPKFCIVLGTSGPKGLINLLDSKKVVEYSQLGFPISKAKGHAPERTSNGPEAKVHYGLLGGVPVLICVGRIHYYECRDMDKVTLMVRSICLLGIKDFIITNASGVLPKYKHDIKVGDIGIIKSFSMKFMGDSPLIGEEDYFHTFIDPNKFYNEFWVKQIYRIAKELGINAHTSVNYFAVPGRGFETVADSNMFTYLGAHLMGMSAPEIEAITQLDGQVIAVSLVTNVVADTEIEITHESNLDVVTEKDSKFSQVIFNFVSSFKN